MSNSTPPLYKHQKEALEFCTGKPATALFMEQGTGKTKVAIERAINLYQKGAIDCVLIIAPNSVKTQWVEEQFPTHSSIEDFWGFIWDGCTTVKSKNNFFEVVGRVGLAVVSVNVEAFQSDTIDVYIRDVLHKRKVFVVIDESAKIKNGRRKVARGKRAGAERTNKILDLFEKVTYKMILTGTPTPNSPFDLWSQFEFLKQNFFGMDYFMFTHHYGIMVKHSNYGAQKSYNKVIDQKEFNLIKSKIKAVGDLTPQNLEELAIRSGTTTSDIMKIAKMEKYSGYKNLDELKKKISAITFFVRKKDCLDLPDKVYETLYAVMGKEQTKIYDNLKKQMYAEYAGKEITVTSKMTMALRLQMVTGGLFPYAETEMKVDKEGEEYFDTTFTSEDIKDNGKIEVLLDDIETVPEDTFIIVWARFRREIEMIEEALLKEGYTCDKYYGGSSDDVIVRFKNGEFRILIATALKGGEGLNLQIATLHYFYSNSFKADSRLQAEDRSHRIGQTNKVLYKDIICKGTIDEHVYQVLKRKEDLINFFRNKRIEEILG